MNVNLIYREESYKITGACQEVYKTMGIGFLESVYQECLIIEFERHGIPFKSQIPLNLSYQGRALKQFFKPDFICYDKIIVELKAVSILTDENISQVMNYLKATDYKLGILYNFGHYPLLEMKRIPNSKV
jgi:GxxExxY protein